MKKYIGIKEVMAEPMTMGEAADRHLLKDGVNVSECETDKAGYHVVYEDGVHSWCPTEVFQKSYQVADTVLDSLIIEYDDLREKIRNLRDYLNTDDFDNLSRMNRTLLARQSICMEEYAGILRKRIEMIENKETEE